jgi:hypothetical protein
MEPLKMAQQLFFRIGVKQGSSKMCSIRSITAAMLCVVLFAPSTPHAQDALGIRIDSGFTTDDNVTRSFGTNRLSDHAYRIDVNKSGFIPVSERTRVSVAGFVGGERYMRYTGLSHYYYGIFGEYQYRPSGDFYAPTGTLFLRGFGDQYDSNLRDGYRYAVGATVRKSMTDRIELFGALVRNERHGNNLVFDDRDYALRGNATVSIGRNGTFHIGSEFRYGDVVSTAQPAPYNKNVAEAIVKDDVFTDKLRNSYRIRAKTLLATAGYNYSFNQNHALDFSWRWAQSTPTASPGVATPGKLQYIDTQLAVAYLFRF